MKEYKLKIDFYYKNTGWCAGEVVVKINDSYYIKRKRDAGMDYTEFDLGMVENNPDLFERV
jgi:hypothetical protein